MFWSFMFVVIFCECGEMVHRAFNNLNRGIDQINWNSFPIEIQRILLTFTMATQQPIYIRGYGNIVFVRVTVKQVRFINILFTGSY